MTVDTTRGRATSQLRFLAQRVELFERFHSANSRQVVRAFVEELERDDVLGYLAQALTRRAVVSPRGWLDEAQASGRVPPLPDDPVSAMALRWGVIKQVKLEKVDLRYFVSNLFPGAFLDEKLMGFKRLIVHPFAEDCRRLSAALLRDLGEAEWVDVEAAIEAYLDDGLRREGFGPGAWSDADDARVEAEEKAAKAARVGLEGRAAAASPPTAPPARPEAPAAAPPAPVSQVSPVPAAPPGGDAAPADRLAALRSALAARSDLDAGVRHDLGLDLDALALELARPRPQAARIAARLADLAAAAPALAAGCEELARPLRAAPEAPAGEGR